MPKLSDFLFGKKDKVKQVKTTNKTQDELMKLIQEGLTKGSGPLADIFGNKGFDQNAFNQGVVEPSLKNFQEKILPMLQEKFVANNQVGGSGMQRAQAGAASDLQSQLAALMYQAQQGENQQAQQNKLQGVNSLLGKQGVENIYKQGTSGALQGFVQGAGQGLGRATGAAIAG